jgi:hypothetical protein
MNDHEYSKDVVMSEPDLNISALQLDELPQAFIKIYLEESPREMQMAGFSPQQIQACFDLLAGGTAGGKAYEMIKGQLGSDLSAGKSCV